uniref:Uncharacterized protein n=1 Tax=Micromonas pusilla TaxID=38833 RepID=A0A7S0NJF7_MICPS|mmetsp:Transcript_15016/g.63205  ORF Transcript_15016/g.63205 Transcript_15016/m.63205 type:complete len:125 (+) Transcript_15016:400-774(+)
MFPDRVSAVCMQITNLISQICCYRYSVSPEARAIVEKGLREGMEHGVVKGMQLENERRRKAAISYKIKRALGLASSNLPEDAKKRAAQASLEHLKSHIREGGAFPPAQQPRHRRSGSKTSNNSR